MISDVYVVNTENTLSWMDKTKELNTNHMVECCLEGVLYHELKANVLDNYEAPSEVRVQEDEKVGLCKKCGKPNDLEGTLSICMDCFEKGYEEQLGREVESYRNRIERY